MSDSKKTERLALVLSPEEFEAIDDWRFNQRIGSRSEAVRRLIALGLERDTERRELETQRRRARSRSRGMEM